MQKINFGRGSRPTQDDIIIVDLLLCHQLNTVQIFYLTVFEPINRVDLVRSECARQNKITSMNDGYFILAGLDDRRWNTLWDCLMRMYNQLVELGFRYIDGKVVILKEEDDESR